MPRLAARGEVALGEPTPDVGSGPVGRWPKASDEAFLMAESTFVAPTVGAAESFWAAPISKEGARQLGELRRTNRGLCEHQGS